MKVYIGYQCYYDYAEIWRTVEVVFDDEAKALVWADDFATTECEWREYEARDLK